MAEKKPAAAKPAVEKAAGTGCVFCDIDLEAVYADGAWVHETKKGPVACDNPEQMAKAAPELPEAPPAPPAPPPRAALTASALPVRGQTSADEPVVAAAAAADLPDPDTDPQAYQKAIADIRARRKQFGASAQKLALPERRGYHRHWFNDSPGRVEEALNNGWGHVKGQDSKPVRRIVGSGRDGGALGAYAMEIPTPLWDEDQAVLIQAAQDRLDQVKGAGAFRAKPGMAKRTDEEKFYSPRTDPVQVSESIVRG